MIPAVLRDGDRVYVTMPIPRELAYFTNLTLEVVVERGAPGDDPESIADAFFAEQRAFLAESVRDAERRLQR